MELSVRFARLEMKALPDGQNVTENASRHLLSLARGLDALQIHTACEAGRRGGVGRCTSPLTKAGQGA